MLKPNLHHKVAWLLLAAMIGAYLVMACFFPRLYILATYEDLIGEWTQVYLFVATFLLAARQAYVSKRFRLFFSLLALASFYVAGEEISWGQRLLEIQTPEFFDRHNLQGETNLHNFLTGPISTLTKRAIEYALAAGLVGYGLVYPLLLRFRQPVALWCERRGLSSPPLYLWPFFAFGALFELGLFHFNEAEIAEILIPFALSIMILHYRSEMRLTSTEARDRKVASAALAGSSCLVLFIAIALAVGTTHISYNSPRLGPEMAERYYNGLEKFAGRYQRFEQWQTAAVLYLEVHEDQPQRASLLRNLYRCYLQLGQGDLAKMQLEKAIEIDRKRLETRPGSIAAHISLVRNYQLAEDMDMARSHLNYAVIIGKAKQESQPDNAGVAYWLGRSYQYLGDDSAALREFERAVSLQPETLKFRKALLEVEQRISESS